MSLDSEPRLSMRETVDAEIQRTEGQNIHDKLLRYLNNFACNLPGSQGDSLQTTSDRARGHRLDRQQRFLDRVKETSESEEHAIESLRKDGYSEKRIFATEEQFEQDIRTAIEQAGIDTEALAEYIDFHLKASMWPVGYTPKHESVEQIVLPIFVKLREMGYSHRDLY